MKNNSTRFIPFLLAICLIAGIAIGTFYANHFPVTNWASSTRHPTS